MRYNAVKVRLADVPGTPATVILYTGDVKVDRIAFAAGWFLTDNILLKAEYTKQDYKNFPTADYRAGASFNGYVIQAVVGF